MMGAKQGAFWLTLFLAGAATASELRFGIIQLDGAGHGVLIADAPLPKGASVDIQYPGAKHSAACCKRLTAADFNQAPADGVLATDEVGGKLPFVYRVRVPKRWSEAPFLGVAAIGKGFKTRNAGRQLASVSTRGAMGRAGICTSQEGVHLLEKVGATERTHLYLSLGYEVEAPSCP
jgi:hypothetical protein